MSYKHLAGRLIETQRSMLGSAAVDIARSTEGITVTDDGNVTSVDGDGREVVDELARQYTDMLGDAAESRLVAAAREFEDELALPPSLGGPDAVEPADSGPTAPGPSAGDPAAGQTPDARAETVSDGGTVDVRSPETSSGPSMPEPGEGKDAVDVSVPEPVTFEYTVASTVDADDSGADLASVYLLAADGDDWQPPVTVEDAVVDSVTDVTGLSRDELGDVTDHLDPERLLATLSGEDGETVSFAFPGFTVTVHRSGSLAVH